MSWSRSRPCCAAARYLVRSEADAADLVQATLEIAVRKRAQLRDPGSLRAWVLAIETREAFRLRRRLRSLVSLDGRVTEVAVAGPSADDLAVRSVDGGATLPVYLNYNSLDNLPRGPGSTMAMEVLVGVHTHDPGCLADACDQKPVYDAGVQYRVPRIAPAVLAASMPPGGITQAQAIAAADAYIANNPSAYSASWVFLRAELGSRLLIGEGGNRSDGDWVWAIWYVSEDGFFETTVYVDFLHGTANHSSSGNLRIP